MRSTGVVRKIDTLGRVVIPREVVNTLGWNLKDKKEDGTALEIFVEEGEVILREYKSGCIFCGECSEVTEFKGKTICKECFKTLLSKI